MDPEACLQRVVDAIAADNLAEAREALEDYRKWRARGGFEPENGDARANELRRNVAFYSLSMSDVLTRAHAHLYRVYDHYPKESVANASPDSQLGNWRDGLALLDRAIARAARVEKGGKF